MPTAHPSGRTWRGLVRLLRSFALSHVYPRRRPEETPLYQVVQHHPETWLPMAEAGEAPHLPPWTSRRFIPMGPGVEAGVSDLPVETVDLAPTLVGLVRLVFPNALDGEPVYR